MQKGAHQRRTTSRVSHTFHMPRCSLLVRNNNYGHATKPFRWTKQYARDTARYGNSRSLARSKGLLLEGAQAKLGEPLCIALTKRQHQQRCSSYAGAKVVADTRACCSDCVDRKTRAKPLHPSSWPGIAFLSKQALPKLSCNSSLLYNSSQCWPHGASRSVYYSPLQVPEDIKLPLT